MTFASGSHLGSYEITGLIGVGGMGEVYRARDTKLGRAVAIKTLPRAFAQDGDRLARFEREAKLLASLNHAHIANIYGLDEHEGTRYVAMELVEGETLEQKLKAGPLPLDAASRLALQIAAALEAAHDKGVVHRDLKPANVMITADGQVKVLDFGLAKSFAAHPNATMPASSPEPNPAMTQQGIILGTPAYMSPEQASGQATDQRTDIWAFGVVLFEMLTGAPLFSGGSVPHVLAAVLQKEPDWNRLPKNLHPQLRRLLAHCLWKEARSRYHSMADVRIDLEEVLGDPTGVGRDGEPAAPGARQGIAGRLAVAIIATAAIAAFAAFVSWPKPAPEPVTRFSYRLPSDLSRETGRSGLALSRDGRQFAVNTTQGLYLRRLDALDARLIPGTEDSGNTPLFSPDGQFLAYYADGGRLKRIASTGGVAVSIASDVRNPLGASWSSDGTILFAQDDGIHRVSSNGRDLKLVIPSRAGEQLQGPQLLPDGDSVLFSSSQANDWDAAEIVVQSLSTGDRKIVLKGGSEARYVSTGHLIYAFERDLFAVAFDMRSLSVSGASIPVVRGLSRNLARSTGAADYAIADNGTLVYSARGSTEALRTLVWVDRDGREERIPVEASAYVYPRLSPDGRSVALDDRNPEGDIWIWDLEAKTRMRLSLGAGGGDYPVWDRRGDRIAFGKLSGTGIFMRAANDTGTTLQLLGNDRADFLNSGPYFFSLDGTELFFRASGNRATGSDIAKISTDGKGDPVPLLRATYDERNAELSPDGRWMAYQSNKSGRWEVEVRPFPNVESNSFQVSNNGGEFPMWSRNGSELFYLEPGSVARLMAVTVEATDGKFDLSSRNEVMKWPYFGAKDSPGGRPYDISNDGQRFLAFAETPSEQSALEIIVVENWTEELKRLMLRN